MPVMSWNGWPRLAVAACALLGVVACAPNSARRPMEPRLAVATDGEREQGRYGTLLRLAASARAAGDPAAAVSLYQQAIAEDRGRIDAYVLLGETLVEMEALRRRRQRLSGGTSRDGDNVAAHRGYARAMLGLNRPEAAIVHYQAVLGEAPNDLQAHNGLGVAYDLAGQHEAAAGRLSRRSGDRAGQHAPAQQSRPVPGALGQARGIDRDAARAWPTSRAPRRATGRTSRSPMVWPATSRPPSGSAGSISTRSRSRTTSATSPRSRLWTTGASAPRCSACTAGADRRPAADARRQPPPRARSRSRAKAWSSASRRPAAGSSISASMAAPRGRRPRGVSCASRTRTCSAS